MRKRSALALLLPMVLALAAFQGLARLPLINVTRACSSRLSVTSSPLRTLTRTQVNHWYRIIVLYDYQEMCDLSLYVGL